MTSPGDSDRVKVHAIVLAAGSSTRMAAGNKLLAHFEGEPLVRRVVQRTAASRVAGTIVVTGHDADRVETALAGLPIRIIGNPAFASGLASSLRAGIAALPADATGTLVILADMPAIETSHLDALLLGFEQSDETAVIRATDAGQPRNPVILPRTLLAQADGLRGDFGARYLVEESGAEIIAVEIGPAASLDVDTAAALAAAGGVLS